MKIFFICLFLSVLAFPQANWEKAGNMPYPVSGASIVKKDSLIYIFGGYSDSLQSEVDYIQEFNPARNTWRIAGHLNEKRIGLCAVNLGDSVVILAENRNTVPPPIPPSQSSLLNITFKPQQ